MPWPSGWVGRSSWTDSAQKSNTGLSYELHDAEIAEGTVARFVRKQSSVLKDGSQPFYLEPVPELIKTAQAARKWQAMAAFLPEGDEEGALELARYCNKNPNLTYEWEA